MKTAIVLSCIFSQMSCFSFRYTTRSRTSRFRFSIKHQHRCTSKDNDEHLSKPTPKSLRQNSQQSTLNKLATLLTSTAAATMATNIGTASGEDRQVSFLYPLPSDSDLDEWDGQDRKYRIPVQQSQEDLILPLNEFDGVWTVNYTIGAVMFRAIVDTGSPFLIVPSVCSRSWGGCSQTGRFPLAR